MAEFNEEVLRKKSEKTLSRENRIKSNLIKRKSEVMCMKLVSFCIVSILLILSLLIGCAAPAAPQTPAPAQKPSPAQTAPVAKTPIKIGHIRSLTGPVAITNKAMIQGFDLGLELANYEVAGRKIEVILEDDAVKPELAIDKARKLVEQDKVDMIVGPTTAGLQIALAGFANKAGIPNINTNTSHFKSILLYL